MAEGLQGLKLMMDMAGRQESTGKETSELARGGGIGTAVAVAVPPV